MEVTLKAGDSLNIPEGCKVVIKDNVIVFEREEKEEAQDFKEGDVLCSIYDNTVLIFKDVSKCARGYFDSHYNNKGSGNQHWNSESFRHATEEEKQLLFDKMKEQCLRWNAEEKRVEKIRWRAKKGEEYHTINSFMESAQLIESGDNCDNGLWNALNYFHTEEQTAEAARRIREALRQYHEEIGE